ncbi:MAG: DNA methyltransferase [Arcicella sp.]|nr:DNA methyltransferase [Arcicella sp.]
MITVTKENNMELMARYPDNYFDIAIVDPPYGILNKTKRGGDYKFNMNEYSQWDVKPNDEYFNELFRVSKHQIIWGGNYFGQLWKRSEYNKGFIIWDKNQPEALNNFSMAEMAWSSIDKPSKIFHFSVRKNRNKIHPTQKPVELYEWLLKMYVKPNDKVLDTHLGSGTIVIACHNAGINLTACEINETYFNSAVEKIKDSISSLRIEVDTEEKITIVLPNKVISENEVIEKKPVKPSQLNIFNERKPSQKLIKQKVLSTV